MNMKSVKPQSKPIMCKINQIKTQINLFIRNFSCKLPVLNAWHQSILPYIVTDGSSGEMQKLINCRKTDFARTQLIDGKLDYIQRFIQSFYKLINNIFNLKMILFSEIRVLNVNIDVFLQSAMTLILNLMFGLHLMVRLKLTANLLKYNARYKKKSYIVIFIFKY